MRTLYLEPTPVRFVLTKALARLTPAAYFAPISPLHLAELPDPPLPAPEWVRVRNRLCGICGSDLHQIFLDASLDVAPTALPAHRRIYLGHEMVGEVVEVGPEVQEYRLGDRVVRWGRADDCLARGRQPLCPACARGHRVLCEFASEPKAHTPAGGGFGDSFITPASTLVALAEFRWQAEMARQFGAEYVFLAGDDGFRQAAGLTGARVYEGRPGNRMLMGGFDTVFDVVGIPSTLNNALRWTKARGTVVLVGVNLHRMNLDVTPVWYQEVNLLGAVGHDIVEWQGEAISTFDLAMRWMGEGRLLTAPLLTHRFPLASYRQALTTAIDKAGQHAIKVAFEC